MLWACGEIHTLPPLDRMDQAVERMAKILLGSSDSASSTPIPNSLQRVLFGLARPSRLEEIGEIQYFNPSSLNPSQKQAVKLALSAPELALIHGPPGVCLVSKHTSRVVL